MISSWYNQDTVKISWYHQNIIKISSSYRNIIMISSRYHDINIISSSYHQDIMISWYQQHIIKLSSRYHDTACVRSIPPIPCIGIGITPIPVSASICCIDTGIIISQYRHLHGWYLYLYCSNGIVVSVFYHYESQPCIGIDQAYLYCHIRKVVMQFIIDCSVLPMVISAYQTNGPLIHSHLYKITRTWCRSLHRDRLKSLGRYIQD